jgi:hypothetical protein
LKPGVIVVKLSLPVTLLTNKPACPREALQVQSLDKNTLAYLSWASTTEIKSFMTLTPALLGMRRVLWLSIQQLKFQNDLLFTIQNRQAFYPTSHLEPELNIKKCKQMLLHQLPWLDIKTFNRTTFARQSAESIMKL